VRRDAIRWLAGLLGTVLVVVSSSAGVRGGFSQLPQASSLPSEVSAFAADFSRWNAAHSDLFLRILETTPAAERGAIGLRLFWLWLLNPWGDAFHGVPPSSGGLVGSLTAPPIAGLSEAGAPSFALNGGTGQSEIENSSGNVWSPSDPLPQYGTPNNGAGTESNLSVLPPLSNEPPALTDPVAVPEPAAITLLAVGGLGLLLVRKLRNPNATARYGRPGAANLTTTLPTIG
jgi:hypothetical protein